MAISPIGNAGNVEAVNSLNQPAADNQNNTQKAATTATKQDTLYISEQAKDLAAKLAGTTAQEEQQESASTKAIEGTAD